MKPNRLCDRLRAGDPLVAGNKLEEEALARLQRGVAALETRMPRRSLFALLLPAGAAAVVVLALGWRWLDLRPDAAPAPSSPVHDDRALPVDLGGGVDDGARQLQFETPGGTRVVWLLDPNFTL